MSEEITEQFDVHAQAAAYILQGEIDLRVHHNPPALEVGTPGQHRQLVLLGGIVRGLVPALSHVLVGEAFPALDLNTEPVMAQAVIAATATLVEVASQLYLSASELLHQLDELALAGRTLVTAVFTHNRTHSWPRKD